MLAASIFLFFAGTDLQAVHIKQMPKPRSQFPKAVFISIFVILICFIGSTLAIGFVTPQKDINLLSTLFTSYNKLWGYLGCPWLGNVMALLITVGVLAQVAVNLSAPSTGLLSVGRAGYLPPILQKVNKNGVQTPILWIQGAFVTILGVVLLILPSVQSAYQILGQLSTILYLIMVILVYVAFVVLRYTEPNKTRGYKVPGGKVGMWIVSIIGVVGVLFAMAVSFVPPSQIETGSSAVYVLILIIGTLFFAILPFIIYKFRKKSWYNPDTKFYPFDWEIEGRRPLQASKWPKGYSPKPEQVTAFMDRYGRDMEIFKKSPKVEK